MKRLRTFVAIIAVCAGAISTAHAVCGPNLGARLGLVSPTIQLPWADQMAADSMTRANVADENSPIVGLWDVKLFIDGNQVDEGFDQWHSDGTEVLNDNGEPEPPNSTGAVCLGVFKQTGPRTYKLTHPGWFFDANGSLSNVVELLETITVDKNGNSYQGSFIENIYDLSGKRADQLKGTLTATRITPD